MCFPVCGGWWVGYCWSSSLYIGSSGSIFNAAVRVFDLSLFIPDDGDLIAQWLNVVQDYSNSNFSIVLYRPAVCRYIILRACDANGCCFALLLLAM